jgi:hypothetical protein
MRNRDIAKGAALAGVLLLAVPILEFVLGGKGPTAARVLVGSFGVVFLFLSARINSGKDHP